MNQTRFEWKVGVFVVAGLTLLALLILNFSKGVTLFQPTYDVTVVMNSVAGLKPTADVMMAGVAIGKVVGTTLSEDGRKVEIKTQILSKFNHIRKDAHFKIDSIGFLGDQYVSVTPPETPPPANVQFLKNGDTVQGETGFELQQALLSTAGMLDLAKQTLRDIDQAVTNVNRTVLSPETLGKFSKALDNLEGASESAVQGVDGIRGMLNSNAVPINVAITNLQEFAKKLNRMADQMALVIDENRPELASAVKNLHDVSATFKQLADDLKAGKGAVGSLLYDEHTKAEFTDLISKADNTASNLSSFTQNLRTNSVWHVLFHKPPEASPAGNR
jgi:phospholipid/cholesterol/gamma-HCH transport system substrate-binding protein